MLSLANDLLKPIGRDVVFVGGATVHLHVDDPGAAPVRTTKDVDVVVAVANYADFSLVEEELRQHGFEQLMSEDSPICRWTKGGLLLDVMPTKPEILGFSESKWFDEGFKNAMPYAISDRETISVFDIIHLLAAKIEAFQERGREDLFASRDFEDIATILDGNTRVWKELRSRTPVARFVNKWLRALDEAQAADALAGHVGGYERAALLLERIGGLPEK